MTTIPAVLDVNSLVWDVSICQPTNMSTVSWKIKRSRNVSQIVNLKPCFTAPYFGVVRKETDKTYEMA